MKNLSYNELMVD